MMSRTPRKSRARRYGALVAVLGLLATTGCGYQGLNSLPMPGAQGKGEGAYTLKVELASAAGLHPNTQVMVSNVNVGSVVSIGLQDWNALVTVRLNADVTVPEDSTARVAHTSLLGSKHLELDTTTARPDTRRLGDGATIPLASTGSYPDTEDVLAAASVLLSGGGLDRIRTITGELNTALGGRRGETRQVIDRVAELADGLAGQRETIVDALTGLDRLGKQAAKHTRIIGSTLDDLPPALDVLIEQRKQLTATLLSVGDFSDAATSVVRESREPLVRNLRDLTPTLRALADAGDSLVGATGVLGSGLFPLSTFERLFLGDYGNIFLTIDLTNQAIDDYYISLLRATPLGMALPSKQKSTPGQAKPTDPLEAPVTEPERPARDRPQSTSEKPDQTGIDDDGPDDSDTVGGLPGGLLGNGGGNR